MNRTLRMFLPMALTALLSVARGLAGPLTVEFRNTAAFAESAVDQFGHAFTVAGVSGIGWLGESNFVAVCDNSSHLIFLTIETTSDGALLSVNIDRGFTLTESRDFEGIAIGDAGVSVFLSDEGGPDVCEFDTFNGGLLQTLSVPPLFANRRANFGFESLTRHPSGDEIWTANEEALTIDGPASSQSAGSVVRLVRFAAGAGQYDSAEQLAYVTEPLHGTPINGSRSGLVDLVELPDRRLLALERSFALGAGGFFRNRIFEINRDAATDVSGLTSGLIGQNYTPVAKVQLWSGSVNNLEGLTLGRWLPGGRRSLIGVVDDGDPLSTNRIAAFVLDGAFIAGDTNCDGAINNFDIDAFALALTDAAAYAAAYAACDILAADANRDGAVDNFDIDSFVDCLQQGACP
ncbi:MAG: esterase-like activity of phytase family protein [Phycisphaerales bacterium]|nr:esterase-like activity of phytase family protein [Phycisphaerales bacterium]